MICDLTTVHHVVVPPVDCDGQLRHAVRVRHFRKGLGGKRPIRQILVIVLSQHSSFHLCGDVVSLPVPLEGGQGVAVVGVAGEGELVAFPQRVRRQP